MPAPTPLTACDPPQLDWSRPGIPAAPDFDDIYFSVDGGLEETQAVYLEGCGLPDGWKDRLRFAIGELGFGSGLNFLAAWRLWDVEKPENGHLHFVSIEKYPFSQKDLERALAAWPELEGYANRLTAQWPGPVKGVHKLQISADVTLTLIHDDVEVGLKSLEGQIDAWFLDGFSPSKNPDMWSEAVMLELARLSAPGARIGTFTVAGAVRSALNEAGFEVEKKAGFGRKRHRLEARFKGAKSSVMSSFSPVIIGAGIAGASLARAFLRRGIIPVIIDPRDDTAASGNPAAIIKPRLDLQDRPESRFFLESYLFALNAYEQAATVLSTGIFHAAKTERDALRFQKLALNSALPQRHMIYAKGPYDLEGLSFPHGLVIDPVKTCEAFTRKARIVTGRADDIREGEKGLDVLGGNGAVLASGSHVFVCAGAGIKSFGQNAEIDLRYSRGQITSAEANVSEAFTYGGYAVPLEQSVLLGATHARLTSADPYKVTAEDDKRNIEAFVAMTGERAGIIDGGSRASVRVNRANTLPLVKQTGDIFTVTALGSRGFVFAPLLGEQIVSLICNEPRACIAASLLVT